MAINYKEEQLPSVSTFPFDISHWGGVNMIKANQYDYEMSDCKNMGVDNYPYASPRKPREHLLNSSFAKRIYKIENGHIYYTHLTFGYLLCYSESDGTYTPLQYTDENGDTKNILIGDCTCTNNYDKCSIFYPAMMYTDENGKPVQIDYPLKYGEIPDVNNWCVSYHDNFLSAWIVSSKSVYIEEPSQRQITIYMVLPEKSSGNYVYPHTYSNIDINNRYLPKLHVKIYGSDGNVKKYTVDGTKYNYIEVAAEVSSRKNTYTVNIPDDVTLEKGDYIEIELGLYFSNNDYSTDVINANIKYALSADWYIGKNSNNVNAAVRTLKYGVVYNNRIVGVNGNDIRASALGDFTNFWEYADEAGNPSATGAYATDVGSAGDFTGICVYNNMVMLFKKDIVYEMYGSMPYTITKLCSTGCVDNDSICEIDGMLYWASPKGIVRYSGGVPVVISNQIDIDTSGNCKAGTDGRRYYVYDGKLIYVYDTLYGIWHIEDGKEVRAFYNDINCLYMVSDDGIYRLNSGEEEVEWEFTTKDYTFSSAERKNLSKLWVRTHMSRMSQLEVYVRQDGGDWIRAAVKTAEKDEMFDFKLRIRKCDSFTLKFKGKGDVRILDIHGKVTVGTSKHRSGASLNVYRR